MEIHLVQILATCIVFLCVEEIVSSDFFFTADVARSSVGKW